MKKNRSFDTVILAAGLGTRMKSASPKVLHKICEKPILWWVVRATRVLRGSDVTIVLGHGAPEVRAAVKSWTTSGRRIFFAEQKRQLGSGDALKSALGSVGKNSAVVVLAGDAPLIRGETLLKFAAKFVRLKAAAAVLTADVAEPFGYGRVVRAPSGEFIRIAEEKDASPAEKSITEINTGAYCFDAKSLRSALAAIRPQNAKKEYYLTDALEILRAKNLKVVALRLAAAEEALGINTRAELAAAEKILRRRINTDHMLSGVTFIDPDNAYVGPDVKIGADTCIFPGAFVKGASVVGKNCVVGSGSYIKDSAIGDHVRVRSSYIYSSKISSDVLIGPFAHLRPGTVVKSKSRVGNFTEIKNSFVGDDTKVSHLAYIGDAHLAGGINIGAGVITCNYDGKNKHKTAIGKNSFVGSNVNLVAPVKIGRNALIGAGSTITENVPDGALAIERGRQINKIRADRGRKAAK